jgi:hypothetical protein
MAHLFPSKKLILLFPILLIAFTVCAQADTSSVPIIAYWAKGDSYNFRVTKIKNEWKQGKQTKSDSTTQIVHFKVVDSTEADYTIEWSYQSDLQTEYNIPEKYEENFSKYKETKIIYKTSETGEFQGIENWKQLSARIKDLSAEMTALIANDKSLNQDDFNNAIAPILQVYQSKEGIEQLVYKEIQLMHFPFGFEFEIGKIISYEESLPNMLGGEPLKGESKIYIDQVNRDESFCVVKNEMNINPDDAKRMVLEVFKKTNIKADEFEKAMSTAVFDIRDRNKFEMYFDPGIPVWFETRRTVNMDIDKDKGTRLNILRIELID